MKKIIIVLLMVIYYTISANAQKLPEIGAQVWIEPGHSDEQIEGWFNVLSENHMNVARLFIMWNYIEETPGKWDFSLYDKVFDAAQKHNVKIIATLTTNRRPPHRGDFYQLHATKLEDTEARFAESKIYIKKIVEHYASHPALDSWIVTNESGQRATPYPLAIKRFRVWLKEKYNSIDFLNSNWGTAFRDFSEVSYSEAWDNKGYWNWKIPYMDWHIFYRDHLLWWMTQIKNEIKKYDPQHDVQYHSENVIGNLAMKSYEFHSWREEADNLGLSCHPSWAFNLFEKNEFSLGISYVTDMFYGVSYPKPFIVNELQGGTNFQSGGAHPMTPSPDEITQWLWTSFGGGAQKVIFWLLNDRLRSFESTEWSMLDFQDNPTQRLLEAGKVAETINQNKDFFELAKPYDSKITLLLSMDSQVSDAWSPVRDYVGRSENAQVVSALGYFKAFNRMGVHCNIANIEGFNWNEDEKGRLVILPHITVLPYNTIEKIKRYVAKGNTVLITGFSGMYDEWTNASFTKKSPLNELVGGRMKDYELIAENFTLNVLDIPVKAHMWRGEIDNISGSIIGKADNKIVATSNNYGNGEVFWIPSLLGISAFQEDTGSLIDLLSVIAEEQIKESPIKFIETYDSAIHRLLKNNNELVSIICNDSYSYQEIEMNLNAKLRAEVIWGDAMHWSDNVAKLNGKETIVVFWK